MAHVHAHPIIPHDLFTQEVPPSPTLTNPDMILPYHPLHRLSPIPQGSLPDRPDSAVSLSSSQPDAEPTIELGIATTMRMPSRSAPPISTSYNGYEHGAPLSDIGEEETPRSRKSRRTVSPTFSDDHSPVPPAPPSHLLGRLSNRSSSSQDSDLGNWEDFDSSTIMDERLAADVAKMPDDKLEDLDSKRNSGVVTNSEDDTTSLNERAERILDQARKRLTHMEDNLSKARHSILLSSKSSPNMSDFHKPAGGLYRSISLAGTGLRKSRPSNPVVRANSTAHSRGGSDTTGNPGLKRLSIISEMRSASALEYGYRQESPKQLQASPSMHVDGYSPASNRSHNSPLRSLQEEPGTPSTSKTSPESAGPRGLGINTLGSISREDVSIVTSSPSTAIARSSSQMSNRSTKEIREQMSDLRSRISDLKEKAQADSLRRRSIQSMRTPSPFTNAPSPEGWYTSGPEYKEAGSPLNTGAGIGWSPSQTRSQAEIQAMPTMPRAQTLLNIEQPSTNDARLRSEARTDKNTPSLHKSVNLLPAPREEAVSVIQESLYEDAAQDFDDEEPVATSQEEQIYLNEVLQESLQEVEPEVPELPEHFGSAESGAERHEDRLDAFDYENMFLHSALGNYTGTGTRNESPSESDDGSDVTTRMDQNTPTADDDDEEAPAESDADTEERADTPVQGKLATSEPPQNAATSLAAPIKPWMKTTRSNSMDSSSSVATFATATEGGVGGKEQDDDGVPEEILQWGYGLAFPHPPRSPHRETAPPIWPASPINAWVPQVGIRSPQKMQTPGSVVANGIPTPPVQSPNMTFAASPGVAQRLKPLQNEGPPEHPANTEILMESLIKLADPDFRIADGQEFVTFSDVDKDLVLDLLRAVGGVCSQILKAEQKSEVRAARVLRRRLDGSRRFLEGQSDE